MKLKINYNKFLKNNKFVIDELTIILSKLLYSNGYISYKRNPIRTLENNRYIVKENETLDEIAKDFNINKNIIKKYNKINDIYKGLAIIIPFKKERNIIDKLNIPSHPIYEETKINNKVLPLAFNQNI
ncbi:MAG: LysM peptidoglycan-binding domain-containing protein [Bacilli bacterium]|nr:LysM peptidoglycan-binding domain-containing protein [Bacilli bacterium]